MLKALELSGFKSFADRTRFEFPRGISVVVGPNGSGKSNLVDAVKWVLGSQSAKSLRGKEMTDVIFNGCASRGPLGTGEVTLTLDNATGQLPIDTKEVYLTRRVYRSGEGEYLLNRQPCRLRDIRDLLAGTGITTEAYCIIEQGKVDALLQSSPRDRRVIFEEAAGISQFKAKKAAAARRMERVEQNLLRLSDIVEEVESRLRSVRAQAGKARRYRECTERLQELRTEVALVDWRTLTRRMTARNTQLAELRHRADEQSAALQRAEADAQELEVRLESTVQQSRQLEAAASATRERIAACEATVESQRSRRADLLEEANRICEHLTSMSGRADSVGDRFRDTSSQLQAAEAELAAADLARREHVERAAHSQLEELAARANFERVRNQAIESARLVASLAEQLADLEGQFPAAETNRAQHQKRIAALAGQRDDKAGELAVHERAEADLISQVETHQESLRAAEQRLAQVRRELTRADAKYRQIEVRLTRTRERIVVLSELEHRLEGLDGGVQQVLRMARETPQGPLSDVHGVVADLFHVDVDSAPLVEMALGERTQYAVVSSANRLLQQLESQSLGVTGRVGFLPLDTRAPLTALDHVDLSAEPGVMGRADRFIEATPNYQSLVRRLLGRTWLVDRLTTALRLAQTAGRGLDFVTSDGELLAADGTLVIGPRHAAAGILSRRSELRACRDQVHELENQLNYQATMHHRLDQERAQQESLVAASVAAHTAAAGKLAELGHKTATCRVQLDRITDELTRTDSELRAIGERMNSIRLEIQTARQRQAGAEATATQLETERAAAEQQMAELQIQQVQLQAAATERQISAAKSEQCVEMLRHQLDQAQRSQQERDEALAESERRLVTLQQQGSELEEAMLAGRQALAELFLTKELHTRELDVQNAADQSLRQERSRVADEIRAARQQISEVQAQQHKAEVTLTRIRHERQTLQARMQEDYGIDLEAAASGQPGASATESPPPVANGASSPIDREAVEREIAELREQINSIGAINLEALDELEQLEARFERLSGQHRDLVDAKESLGRIIHRINTDSRNLFLSTLEMIRGHFQELFRRLFGGGEADIVVDEAEDVLECGIEIVARPPGKEACSISLLSGGEKTLTCVALLLAVFRSKPSPFCVLDEVDAALDEANIGRFIGVLREFLSFTQFVVVTHSKKTMGGADTLYGVTMEESGVSKRVSVRFEDVTEDGQILPSALRRPDSQSAANVEAASRRAA